eukprot:4386472-Prymnesium_polylepis.1
MLLWSQVTRSNSSLLGRSTDRRLFDDSAVVVVAVRSSARRSLDAPTANHRHNTARRAPRAQQRPSPHERLNTPQPSTPRAEPAAGIARVPRLADPAGQVVAARAQLAPWRLDPRTSLRRACL